MILNYNEMPCKTSPVTDKQKKLIEEMGDYSDFPIPIFTGKTKAEASEYIDKYLGIASEAFDFAGHEDNYGYRD